MRRTCCGSGALPTPRGEPRFGVDCAPSRGDPPATCYPPSEPREAESVWKWQSPVWAKPHQAGGGGGQECAASLRAEQRLAPGGRAALTLTRTVLTAQSYF